MDPDALLEYSATVISVVLGLAGLRQRLLQHWLFLGAMLALGVGAAFTHEMVEAGSSEAVAHAHWWGLAAQAVGAGFWLCFSFVYARGAPWHYLKRHRWALTLGAVAPVFITLFFRDGLFAVVSEVATNRGWWISYRLAGKYLNILFLLTYVAVLMNLEATFRASVGTIRWRIKFAILGMAVVIGIRIYSRSQALLFSGESIAMAQVEAAGLLVGGVLMLVALARGGFSLVDIYPSSAIRRRSLTVIITAGYFLVVGVLAQIVALLGGASHFPAQAFLVLLAIVSVAILFLSNRFRDGLHRFINRRFHRPLHDFRRVWTLFSEKLTSELSPSGYCQTAATLIAETFSILSVTIWLLDERKQRLTMGASTSTLTLQASKTDPEFAESQQVIVGLAGKREPFNLEKITEPWADVLRRWNISQFADGGDRWGLPLTAGDRLFGIAVFADRVNGAPYTFEELDLLGCIGGQISGGLLNLRLTEELMQAKEMEAFQTMSAFFVHDLKNAASTLNLMLRNLPVHFDNPEFRADTLRGIGNTVQRINQLISRLGVFRSHLELKMADADLNGLVEKALADFALPAGLGLEKDLGTLPQVRIDAEQIESVVVNLLVNAREAMERGGTIRVETRQNHEGVSVTVVDEGSGMTPEFLARNLFRPFHTTKKKGLGVGMFQSKVIVEAHRGRIQVESEVGRGSTFCIILPREVLSK